jgi:hypothetical protein
VAFASLLDDEGLIEKAVPSIQKRDEKFYEG